jgi:DNA-binding transcriptional ArsR family regulator
MSRCHDRVVATDLVTIGRALSTPARAAMVVALFDGTTHTAGELAAAAGVGSGTASDHLRVLVDSGLVTVRADGRFRCYQLADERVAHALEILVRPGPLPEVTSLRMSREQRRVRLARTCYDHLAGVLGVSLADAVVARGWIDADRSSVTPRGETAFLEEFGVDVPALRGRRRPLLRSCVDWTERRPHLAGALGAAVTTAALERAWVERKQGSRGLVVTPAGRSRFAELGVELEAG